MAQERLDKLISGNFGISRSDAKLAIKNGKVLVNGVVKVKSEDKFNTSDTISYNGNQIKVEKFTYLMLNKPVGYVSATVDKEEKTVLELLPDKYKKLNLFPVGRLDKDTVGLLILTNDGAMAHKITSPKKDVFKRYEAFLEGSLSTNDVLAFEKGIELRDGTICRSSLLEIDEENHSHCFVSIKEGKYHQVKRMLASRKTRVTKLKRLSIGGLFLDESLSEGEFRSLSLEEVEKIFGE